MKRVLAIVLGLCSSARADHAEHPARNDGDPFKHEHSERYEPPHQHRLYGDHDACEYELADPVPTPLHPAGIDDQRAACLRTEVGINVTSHALIDTDEFHGHLGGDVVLDLRHVFHAELEVGARLSLVDFNFVQTAVNKATETIYGPLLLSIAWGRRLAPSARFAIVASAELPYTRTEREVLHSGGELSGLVTGALTEHWTLHTRLGGVWSVASSEAGTSPRLAIRAGFDLAWRSQGSRIALITGAETSAGFTGGLDTVMLREGFQLHVGDLYRFVVGIGIPLTGNDRTTAIVSMGVSREL
jgi:hypothetical protein